MSEKIINYTMSTIAEMTNGIILANFKKDLSARESSYQSESDLERKMIDNLVSQGYEFINTRTSEDLYRNLRLQIEKLNNVSFSNDEWKRFLIEYLDAPNDGMIEKTRKIQEDYIYDCSCRDYCCAGCGAVQGNTDAAHGEITGGMFHEGSSQGSYTTGAGHQSGADGHALCCHHAVNYCYGEVGTHIVPACGG